MQNAVVKEIHEVLGEKDAVLPVLEMNIVEVLSEEQIDLPAEDDEELVRRLTERLTIFDEKTRR